MFQPFVFFGGKDKKLILENATHPCPRCKRRDTVQLTRVEKRLVILNKRIELPNSMRVRYECRKCHWKNETLPDDDPLYQSIPTDDNKYLSPYRKNSIGYNSVESFSTVSLNSIASIEEEVPQNYGIYVKPFYHYY